MNEDSDQKICEPETVKDAMYASELEMPDRDDRYPGSFFRIPGTPIPGKTAWSIS
jgi:hypothetical protein